MPEPSGHRYPSAHRPGSHWATDEAWQILDLFPVGMMPDDARFLLAGMIAGALLRRTEPLRNVLVTASHALKSYAHGNASPVLAKEGAAACDAALARLEASS